MSILGNFETQTQLLLSLISDDSSAALQSNKDSLIVPVHEMQVSSIRDKFTDVEILPESVSVPALGQSSVRQVPSFKNIDQM
jgi:hypothetical protein